MDNKVKSSVLFFLFLIFMVLSLNKSVAFYPVLVLSLTTIFYNIKKGVSVYLLLGITGIYLSAVLKNKTEGFQNNNSNVPTVPTTTADIVDSPEEEEGDRVTMTLTLKNLKELTLIFDAGLLFPVDTIVNTLKMLNIDDIFKLKIYL